MRWGKKAENKIQICERVFFFIVGLLLAKTNGPFEIKTIRRFLEIVMFVAVRDKPLIC